MPLERSWSPAARFRVRAASSSPSARAGRRLKRSCGRIRSARTVSSTSASSSSAPASSRRTCPRASVHEKGRPKAAQSKIKNQKSDNVLVRDFLDVLLLLGTAEALDLDRRLFFQHLLTIEPFHLHVLANLL